MCKQRDELMQRHLEQIADGGFGYEVEYFQQRPYTMVRLGHEHLTDDYLGFAKANWPDQWDSQYGVDLALRKAVAGLVRDEMA